MTLNSSDHPTEAGTTETTLTDRNKISSEVFQDNRIIFDTEDREETLQTVVSYSGVKPKTTTSSTFADHLNGREGIGSCHLREEGSLGGSRLTTEEKRVRARRRPPVVWVGLYHS